MHDQAHSDAKRFAEEATITNVLNCYLRETGIDHCIGPLLSVELPVKRNRFDSIHYLHIHLCRQQVDVYAAVQYVSATGVHRYEFPLFYRNSPQGTMLEADYLTLTALLVKELSIIYENGQFAGEFVYRVIQSCHHIQSFIEARLDDCDSLYGTLFTFIDAEQSLIFGHSMHPTPKSRQGIPDTRKIDYSPELKGKLRMHYFAARTQIVKEGSCLEQSATVWIKKHLSEQEQLKSHPIQNYVRSNEWSILPVHPLQAEHMLSAPEVHGWLDSGMLLNLGQLGEEYYATSSIRTLYHARAPFMIKVSAPIKVTNSLRINKTRELGCGGEVMRLFGTAVGDVSRHYPGFTIVHDPAFITLQSQLKAESGFEVVLRMNPFMNKQAEQVTLIAALVQQAMPGSRSRLANIIEAIALREGRSAAEVSKDWFKRYLKLSLCPMLWLYMKYGVALEAHQQNSVIRLEEGYPAHYYYRDNQGYYFCESMRAVLQQALPGIGDATGNFYEDQVVDERFCYYVIINHMFGLIQGFGSEGLIAESELLMELVTVLVAHLPLSRDGSALLEMLLENDKLPCKANLLTRFHDVDELAGSHETPAIYVQIDNPVYRTVQDSSLEASRKLTAAL
ncbi:IucA/IucC family siderophore biosynthesis protein [Paenibacillus sp. 2TAB23]|uniref:IucA/IucC family protein n=1 Tax=Paenibacillus sp. 2TAB23 TaxID=3233004 RepID=UPI003F9DD111